MRCLYCGVELALLKKLAGSKNVTGQVSQAARQQLARKKKKNE